jgi:hypothetical protein
MYERERERTLNRRIKKQQHSEEVQYSTNRGAQTVDQGCQHSSSYPPTYSTCKYLNAILNFFSLDAEFGRLLL